MPNSGYVCPVCGYANLEEPAYAHGLPSYEICPSCGTEFGYDDAHAAASRTDVFATLRQQWVDRGLPWSSAATDPPAQWNPAEQLASAGLPIPRRRSPTGSPIALAHVDDPAHREAPATFTLVLMPSESRIVLRRLAQSSAIIFDSLHNSLADAQSRAEKEFGISRGAWVNDFPSPSPQDSAES